MQTGTFPIRKLRKSRWQSTGAGCASYWKELARADRLDDAIVAYVAERDFVSWFELTRDFAEFMDTSGDSHAFLGESSNNVVLWTGMSSELCDTVLRL
jgi:hypothetical protein